MSYVTRDGRMGSYEVVGPSDPTQENQNIVQQVGADVQNVAASVVSNPASLLIPAAIAITGYWAFFSKGKPVARMLGLARAKK